MLAVFAVLAERAEGQPLDLADDIAVVADRDDAVAIAVLHGGKVADAGVHIVHQVRKIRVAHPLVRNGNLLQGQTQV